MRKGLLGSIAALTVGAGLAFAQPPARTFPPTPSLSAQPGQPGMPSVDPMPTGPIPMPGPIGPLGPAPFDGNPAMNPGPLADLYSGESLGPGPNTEAGYTNFETLLWFIRSMPSTFPLVSAGTTVSQGAQPSLGSTTLFGADNFQFNPFLGARFTVGKWFQSCAALGHGVQRLRDRGADRPVHHRRGRPGAGPALH